MTSSEPKAEGWHHEAVVSKSEVLSSLEALHAAQPPNSVEESDRRLIDLVNLSLNAGGVAVNSFAAVNTPEVA